MPFEMGFEKEPYYAKNNISISTQKLPEYVQNPDYHLRKFANNGQFRLPPNAVQKGPQHTYKQKNFSLIKPQKSEHENEFHEY